MWGFHCPGELAPLAPLAPLPAPPNELLHPQPGPGYNPAPAPPDGRAAPSAPPECPMRPLVLLTLLAIGSAPASADDPAPVVRSARSGPWSAAATWEGATVPAA